ncbi:MAG: hypothetical protein R2780_11115 [Crocinitomicaceae bacterium]|nr:hypothetical protein [Crocinitomicaceae bacterium]
MRSILLIGIILLTGSINSILSQNIPAALRGQSSKEIAIKREKSRESTMSSTRLDPMEKFVHQSPPLKKAGKLKRGGGAGAFFMWMTFLFCIFSVFSLFSIIPLGWWGVLISFGLLFLALVFYFIGFATSEDIGTVLLGGIINAIALGIAGALDLLVYLTYMIIWLVN